MADLVIEDDVWLCTNCQIVRPVHIGRGSVVAAGCIVTKDVPENVLFGGNPGKVIRYLNT
jgi:acetyltransferase-like isoleucine patch superfamily enzyme